MKQFKENRYVVILLLGVTFGASLHSLWTTECQIRETVTAQYSRSSGAHVEESDVIIDNNDIDVAKMSRFWKYTNTYRYVPAATRRYYDPLPASECGAAPNFDRWWNVDAKHRSRFNEDRLIYETFFKGHNATDFKGTYVELGAHDGQTESNSRFFDICLGWKGLLLEGSPVNYEKTISNRPYANKMNVAPSCSAEYEAVNKTIQFYRYHWTNAGLVGHAKAYEGKETVDVPCGPLSPILEDIFEHDRSTDDVDLPTLDFFSLDVEGAEALVLSTIDFQKIRINVLMIEVQNAYCKNDECQVRKDIRAKMAQEGYKRYENFIRASDVYVHPESPFQIPESRAVPK